MNKTMTKTMSNTLFRLMDNNVKLYIDKNYKTGELEIIIRTDKTYFRKVVIDADDLLFILFDNFINKRKLKETLNLIVAVATNSETNQADRVVLILFNNNNIIFKSIMDKYYIKK